MIFNLNSDANPNSSINLHPSEQPTLVLCVLIVILSIVTSVPAPNPYFGYYNFGLGYPYGYGLYGNTYYGQLGWGK